MAKISGKSGGMKIPKETKWVLENGIYTCLVSIHNSKLKETFWDFSTHCCGELAKYSCKISKIVFVQGHCPQIFLKSLLNGICRRRRICNHCIDCISFPAAAGPLPARTQNYMDTFLDLLDFLIFWMVFVWYLQSLHWLHFFFSSSWTVASPSAAKSNLNDGLSHNSITSTFSLQCLHFFKTTFTCFCWPKDLYGCEKAGYYNSM